MRRIFLLPSLVSLLVSPFGCGVGESTAMSEEAEHPSVVVTQWNDSTELFLEYPHLLSGEATGNWAIHLSDMTDFKPIVEGSLTVRFLQSGQEVNSFTIEGPARDGIFLLDPVITQPGSYEVHLALTSSQAVSTHILPEVQVWGGPGDLPHGEEEGGGISFLKEQQWQIPFAVSRVAEEEVRHTITAAGEIVAPDGALVVVSSPIAGIASTEANQTSPSVGQAVRAGDLLVLLDPLAEEGGLARARGELERLERESERAERLFAAGAIPEKRLEEVRHDVAILRAEMEAMGAGSEEDGYRLAIRAPISGVIAERSFLSGGRVGAGVPLFTIVDPSTLWLRVQLPPDAASSLPPSAQATFTPDGMDRSFETSRVMSVGSVLDSQTRTVPSVFPFENSGGDLKVGQYARVVVPVGGTVVGVAIPNSAIIDDNGTLIAYVQAGGETFERRVLDLGTSDAEFTQVLRGVNAGEMVVTTGAYQIRLASMSGNEFAGAHAH